MPLDWTAQPGYASPRAHHTQLDASPACPHGRRDGMQFRKARPLSQTRSAPLVENQQLPAGRNGAGDRHSQELVLPSGLEPKSSVPETDVLSIELRERFLAGAVRDDRPAVFGGQPQFPWG